MFVNLIALLAVVVCVSTEVLTSQCTRPPIPHGGWPVHELPIETITYSDGVVAEGRLILPTAPVPSCGWPLVVRVHSLGANHAQDRLGQELIASTGYAVWAYDVRGQGNTRARNLTVGTTLYGAVERFDLAEQIAHVRAHHPASVSANKVAIIGVSQGGVHCWMAAAQSGNELAVSGRGVVRFPEIACVVGSDYAMEPTWHRVRGGTLFSSIAVDTATLDPNTQLFGADPGLASVVRSYFLSQDPAGLDAWYRNDPSRYIADELALTTVPVLAFHAWHDAIAGVDFVVRGLRLIPSGVPRRLLVSTVGHGVPVNDAEVRLRSELQMRWLERFLWDVPNGVDREAEILRGAMPLDAGTRGDPRSLWLHAAESLDLVPTELPMRLFLSEIGTLDATEPSSAGIPTRIEHVVAPGFDAATWLSSPAMHENAQVLANIPLSERAFDMTTSVEFQLVGASRLHVPLIPSGPRFTLAALLLVRVPGATDFVMVAHGGTGVLDAGPQVARDVEIELSSIDVRIPAGSTVRLLVRNHWLTELPHVPLFVTVPYFESSTLDIQHGPSTAASWIEMPLRTEVDVALDSPRLPILVNAPGEYPMSLVGGVARAGQPYLLLASSSGHDPATPIANGSVPLVFDGLTEAFIQMIGSPELIGFSGVLDSQGNASATLDLRAARIPVDLVGSRISFAAWVYTGAGDLRGASSAAVDVFFR
ncbi:MAG: alpha/beta fold hydrolase [Planctomycetota bacterium]